jgi:DNA-binding response OmpR family regulator
VQDPGEEGLRLDPAERMAYWQGRRLPLSPREVDVLAALFDAGGRVVTRAELARRVGLSSARRCDSLLVGVRRVLGPHAIRTVRRRGWRLDFATVTAADVTGGSSPPLHS